MGILHPSCLLFNPQNLIILPKSALVHKYSLGFAHSYSASNTSLLMLISQDFKTYSKNPILSHLHHSISFLNFHIITYIPPSINSLGLSHYSKLISSSLKEICLVSSNWSYYERESFRSYSLYLSSHSSFYYDSKMIGLSRTKMHSLHNSVFLAR